MLRNRGSEDVRRTEECSRKLDEESVKESLSCCARRRRRPCKLGSLEKMGKMCTLPLMTVS